MRLPPVYLMDALLVHNMGVAAEPGLSPVTAELNITEAITNSTDLYQTFSTLYGGNPALLLLPHVLRLLAATIMYAVSVLVNTHSFLLYFLYKKYVI